MGLIDIFKKPLIQSVVFPPQETNTEPLPVLTEIKSVVLPINTSAELNLEGLAVGDSLRFVPAPNSSDNKCVKVFSNDRYAFTLDYSSIKVSIFDILTHPELVPSSIEAVVTKINKKTIKADITYRCNPTVFVDKDNIYHHSSFCDKLRNADKTKLSQAKAENLKPCENCCTYEPPRFFYKED